MVSSKLLETALAQIEAYNKWDLDTILSLRTKDCIQQILPASLERPPRTNDEYREYFGTFIPLFKNYNLEVLDTVVDQTAHKVALHAKSTADTPLGPYTNEYMLFFYMTEDDSLINKVVEFVDSASSKQFFGSLGQLLKSKA
ncbi:hypothetical protein BX600DRAFT_431778 [Xylariales sp. PMI_506]|nr:hypothetical protein BX600DRAFT_431778 [Xylariales sp. PMI_506]